MGSIVLAMGALWTGLLQPMSEESTRLRVSQEARMAVESLRRDLGGGNAPIGVGGRDVGRLVGVREFDGELQLCFDGAPENGAAEWSSPDTLVTYTIDGGQLHRVDHEVKQSIVVAANVKSVIVKPDGIMLHLEMVFERRGISQTYSLAVQAR